MRCMQEPKGWKHNHELKWSYFSWKPTVTTAKQLKLQCKNKTWPGLGNHIQNNDVYAKESEFTPLLRKVILINLLGKFIVLTSDYAERERKKKRNTQTGSKWTKVGLSCGKPTWANENDCASSNQVQNRKHMGRTTEKCCFREKQNADSQLIVHNTSKDVCWRIRVNTMPMYHFNWYSDTGMHHLCSCW